jgi:N-acetylneuraminate synthase
MSVFIIAEIGINHNGDLELAKEMIDIAVKYECNAVKFQKRTIDLVYSKEELDKPRESPWGTTNREQKHGLEFGQEEYDEIDKYCKEKGIEWFASSWDLESQKFLQQYDLKYNKIASAMLTYDDLLEMVAKEGKHTLISTGMSSLDEIDHAVEIFRKHKCPFTVMACTSTYPTPAEECNVRFVQTLQYRYPDSIGVGYSSHAVGPLPCSLAVAMGATWLEFHQTLNRCLYGSDQKASLEPRGVEILCRDTRKISTILGDGNKIVYKSEVPIKAKLRKF